MKEMLKNYCEKAFVPIVILAYLVMIAFSYKYEMNPYLWFDEAGQFWISKGLNHDSAPMSEAGGLIDVVKNNQDYNLDPGGFSLLLHLWSKISNNYFWLRTLPFLFLVLTVISFVYLAYRWIGDKKISVLAGFVPLLIPMIFYEGFEIRAYSMEVLGCVVSIIALDSLSVKITSKRLIMWSSIIAFFMTSRYSFIIVAFVVSTYVLYLIYNTNHSVKHKIKMAILYSVPLIIVLIYDYCFAMRYQNPSVKTLSYLPYISDNIKVLIHASSLRHLFYLCLILWLCFAFRKTGAMKKYWGLAYVTVVTNIIFFVFSCLGMHPWDGDTTRCISMITLVVIAITALWCELIKLINNYTGAKLLILLFICMRLISNYKGDIKSSKHRENAYTEFLSLNHNNEKVYVDRWESPCLRYQFEHGGLKGTVGYPDNFYFQKFRKHGFVSKNGEDKKISLVEWYENTQNDLNELIVYDILVVPELYRQRPENSDKWESVSGNNCVWVKK